MTNHSFCIFSERKSHCANSHATLDLHVPFTDALSFIVREKRQMKGSKCIATSPFVFNWRKEREVIDRRLKAFIEKYTTVTSSSVDFSLSLFLSRIQLIPYIACREVLTSRNIHAAYRNYTRFTSRL